MTPLRQNITVTYDSRGVKQARDDMGRYVRQSEEGAESVDRRFGKLSGSIKGVFLGIGAFITIQLVGALKRVGTELFELGSAVGETESKFNTVFGGAAADVNAFIESFSRVSGLTKRQGQDFTSNIGAILQGMGALREESAPLDRDWETV